MYIVPIPFRTNVPSGIHVFDKDAIEVHVVCILIAMIQLYDIPHCIGLFKSYVQWNKTSRMERDIAKMAAIKTSRYHPPHWTVFVAVVVA